jgi:hypothetical protein
MKTLQEYMTEALNEAKWESTSGIYNWKTADELCKAWGVDLKKAYKALYQLEDTDNPPENIKFEKNFKAVDPDTDDTYTYDPNEGEWSIDR